MKSIKYALVVIALVLLAYLVFDFNSRTAEMNRLNAEKEVVGARLTERLSTQAALETRIAYATSEAAAMQYGYEHHLARSGDVPVVPMQISPATPTPLPAPANTSRETSYLERWLILFLGPSIPASTP